MFEPSSEAIIWILGIITTFLAVIVLVTVIAVIFTFTGPPHDIHDVEIDGTPKKRDK
jgi:hypothetical protein